MSKRRQLIILGAIMLTEVLGWALILPFLPFMAIDFGASALTVGLIIASFSLFQFVSAPIIGRLSDVYGRKKLLLLSQLSTFISFLVLGFAKSIEMIFLSRIIDGLLGSNMTLTKAYIGDLTKGKDRAKSFAIFGAVMGIGFFISPGIGGFLAEISYSIPSFLAAGFSLLTLILTLLFLKETVQKSKDFKLKKSDFLPIKDLSKVFKKPSLRFIFYELFFFVLAFSVLTTNLGLFMDFQTGLGPSSVGLIMMMVGLVRIIFQTGIMPKLIDSFNQLRLEQIGLIITGISMFLLGFSKTVLLIYASTILFSIGGGLARPMITTRLNDLSKENERGKVMGVSDSLNSLSRIIGPVIGSFAIQTTFPGSIGIISGVLILVALFYSIK